MNWNLFSPFIVHKNDFIESHKHWQAIAETRMPDVHAKRRSEWAAGRVALEEAFKTQGVYVDLGLAEFEGYQQLKSHPEWRFSISHTSDYAAALILPVTLSHGLGLDIESMAREVSAGVQERSYHAGDNKTLSPLELWCAKEAVYKSLPGPIQQKIWLNSIQVGQGSFSIQGHEDWFGHWARQAHTELVIIMAQAHQR